MVRVPAGYHLQRGDWRLPRTAISRRPAVPSMPRYRTRERGPIRSDGTNQAVINGAGHATVQVGPQGLGTIWYPVQAAVLTTSGAADTSTVQFFNGVVAIANLYGAQSYAGGGDQVGLAGLTLQPGEFFIAVWSGGKPGDVATLRLTGDESYLR